MKETILFGASNLGEVALNFFSNKRKIVGFVDNDKNKWGKQLNNIPIYSPSILLNKDYDIIITSSYKDSIKQQLIEMDIFSFEIFDVFLEKLNNANSITKDNTNLQKISIGALISDLNNMEIADLSFIGGGSTLLDYFLIKAVAVRLKRKVYLEIGTWTGESISAAAEVVEQCISISLQDELLEDAFYKYSDKNNFSRYFSYPKSNVVHYVEDSKNFNYEKMGLVPDLVFIDGDHSYQGVLKDTQNIFNLVGYEDSVVIWHDYRSFRNEIIISTHQAVRDVIPVEYYKNLFLVDNTLCGIYIPEKYHPLFSFENDPDSLYSYKISIEPKYNKR